MKYAVIALSAATLLAGCGGKPNRVDATITGDAGKYQGFPVCLEVSFQNETTLGLYPKDLCSMTAVTGPFEVTVSASADDLENDVYNASGNVFLRTSSATMPINGTVTARTEEQDGDTMTLSVNVTF